MFSCFVCFMCLGDGEVRGNALPALQVPRQPGRLVSDRCVRSAVHMQVWKEGVLGGTSLCTCHQLLLTPPARPPRLCAGAYFGTTFPHLFLLTYPTLRPPRANEGYTPRIFGFKIHPSAYNREEGGAGGQQPARQQRRLSSGGQQRSNSGAAGGSSQQAGAAAQPPQQQQPGGTKPQQPQQQSQGGGRRASNG